jgi:D-2-hydroxyacid dehydrogenase (NADP+)
MLCLSRHIPEVVRNQDRRIWARRPSQLLEGKAVGILGVGAIAAALAPRCKAMGMEVVGISSAPRPVASFDRMFSTRQLIEAVRGLDYFVLLTPYSPATHHLVGEAVLAAMKPTAYLINLARGGVVDEAALLSALERKAIAGAALDVFATEPLPSEHPFWSASNVLITPHLGGFHDRYPQLAMPTIEDNMRRFLAGDHAGMINRITR